MLARLLRLFIASQFWRCGYSRRRKVVTFAGEFSFYRLEFLWPDEFIYEESRGKRTRWNRPPWWRPFNAFLHCWRPRHKGEEFHDHPRWSVTIVLCGKLIERTPWAERVLTPGAIVIRSRKAIHAFRIPEGYRGKTWTLFIVGRRNHRQNRYLITSQSFNTAHGKE